MKKGPYCHVAIICIAVGEYAFCQAPASTTKVLFMTSRPPLCIHLLGHPKSKDAQRLALQLTEYFRQDPLSGGVRVPVFLTPDRGDDQPGPVPVSQLIITNLYTYASGRGHPRPSIYSMATLTGRDGNQPPDPVGNWHKLNAVPLPFGTHIGSLGGSELIVSRQANAPVAPLQSDASILSCVFVSKSPASWRSRSCS